MVEKASVTTNTCCKIFCYYLCCCKCICFRNKCRRFMNQNIYTSSNDMMFGDLGQSRLIMEKNFDGKQFIIEDAKHSLPRIDCMFFPATSGDEVVLDPDPLANADRGQEHAPLPNRFGFNIDYVSGNRQQYLQKSTIIMCNPNALVYQWMITQANAYWLDFFLRRDCNVLIWNYRGYGETEQEMLAPNLTPDQQKLDAERVMQFLVNRLRVQGKIGVYGRSIGGIAASHLVQKFPSIVKVFVGDRTMGNFDEEVLNRYARSGLMLKIYRILSCFWHIDNAEPLYRNKDCYKIMTFDEQDDVLNLFSSLHHQVAGKYSKEDYGRRTSWLKFYKSLAYIFDLELSLSEQQESEFMLRKKYGNADRPAGSGSRAFNRRRQGQRTASSGVQKMIQQSHYSEILASIDQAEEKLNQKNWTGQQLHEPTAQSPHFDPIQ